MVGTGTRDLVFVPGYISHLEHAWEEPGYAHLVSRFGAHSRVILFDKRGTGLSDRPLQLPTLEERMDDVRAVMDAAGSERATIFGISEGGAMSLLFAATYPERTHALVLYGSYGHFPAWVIPPDRFDAAIEAIDRTSGIGASLPVFTRGRFAISSPARTSASPTTGRTP